MAFTGHLTRPSYLYIGLILIYQRLLIRELHTLMSFCLGGGVVVPNYKYGCDKPENKFFTVQAEYSQSCEHLGSCLAIECSMMKSSTNVDLPLYVHLMST